MLPATADLTGFDVLVQTAIISTALSAVLVAQLAGRARDDRPRQHAIVAPHPRIGGKVGVAHQRTDPQSALGLARFERRPDDATLAAVGGTPGLRRRIGLWQGLVIAGFGTFAGATAGILPPIGFWLQSQTGYEPLSLADIPWWLLGALAVALPLGIAAVNWLVPPREPELTRRNVIA